MSEERDRLERDAARGEQVAAFRAFPGVQEAFQGLEMSYYLAWKESRDPAQREVLHAKASVLDELKETLAAVVASGERATVELQDLERATDQI